MPINSKLNFVFWGTPDVASNTLEILKENGYIPSLIVTAKDMPQGRKMIVTPPPVKIWAIKNNIPYIQPETLEGLEVVFKSIAQSDGPSIAIRQQADICGFKNNSQPDLFLIVAYGKIISKELLNLPKLGSLNIHYSLLPKYRGASPVESAILNGDEETGISIQKMIYKMDAGPIVAQEKVLILPDEKASELRTRLIKIGGQLLVKILPEFIEGKIIPTQQDETKATHCKKIKKEDGQINLNDDPIKNYNKFRAYVTWPRTFFFDNDKRIIITKAKLEDNKFVIEKIIPEGGKEIFWKEFKK
jgi:methionyl-tRNA formyltransferase